MLLYGSTEVRIISATGLVFSFVFGQFFPFSQDRCLFLNVVLYLGTLDCAIKCQSEEKPHGLHELGTISTPDSLMSL